MSTWLSTPAVQRSAITAEDGMEPPSPADLADQ
jgi:hypothetical protein